RLTRGARQPTVTRPARRKRGRSLGDRAGGGRGRVCGLHLVGQPESSSIENLPRLHLCAASPATARRQCRSRRSCEERASARKVDSRTRGATLTGVTMKIVAYERPAGEYHFSLPGQVVEGELKDGYRVQAGRYGELMIFGEPGTIGLTLERAIQSGVVKLR